MLFVLWVPLALQFLVALGLLGWLAFGRPSSRTDWLLRTLLVACYIVAAGVGGLWLVLPWYTPLLYAGLFIPAVLRSARRLKALPDLPASPRFQVATVIVGTLLVFSVGLATYILTGWRTPQDAVELSFPLRNGTYLVVNGGGNELINAHFRTLQEERFQPWRGQSYGVDIEKIDGYGFRARGILPPDPAMYAIFSEPLYAPCTGEVLAAVDGTPEMSPPRMDRDHMAGNHVILNCGDAWVMLGHMQKGSVRVRPGEQVVTGQQIGRVGNSGNTGEPHLHIHAQRPGTVEAPLSGHPLPIRFGDRYPVRNARIYVGAGNQTESNLSIRQSTVAESHQ